MGCAVVSLSDIMERVLKKDPLNKIFWEEGDLWFLKKAFVGYPFRIFSLQDEEDVFS